MSSTKDDEIDNINSIGYDSVSTGCCSSRSGGCDGNSNIIDTIGNSIWGLSLLAVIKESMVVMLIVAVGLVVVGVLSMVVGVSTMLAVK